MRETKQMILWALVLMAISAIVGIVVPSIGFGETLKDFNDGSVQKITKVGDGRGFDRTHCGGLKPYNGAN